MSHPLKRILDNDPRYPVEAYEFVRDSLSYAQDILKLGVSDQRSESTGEETFEERHLTGQQLCEASRQYALDQYGMLAEIVLASWGIKTTGDLGEIVYNLIEVDLMRKSDRDQRADFNEVFDFRKAFYEDFDFAAHLREQGRSTET